MDRFLDEMENPLIESQGSAIASQESCASTASYDAGSSTPSAPQIRSLGSAVSLPTFQNVDSVVTGDANNQSLLFASNKYSGLIKFSESGLLLTRSLIDENVPHGCDSVEMTDLTDGVVNESVGKLETNDCFFNIDRPDNCELPKKAAGMQSTSIENQPVNSIVVLGPDISLENGVVLENAEGEKRVSVISTKSCVDSEDKNVNICKVNSTSGNLSLAEDPLITKLPTCSPVIPEFPTLSADLTDIPVETLVLPVDLIMNVDEMDVSIDTLVPLVDNQHLMVKNNAKVSNSDAKRPKMVSPPAEISQPMFGLVPFPTSSESPKSYASANSHSVKIIVDESLSVSASILEEPEVVPTSVLSDPSSEYNPLPASSPATISVDKTDPHHFKTSSDVGSPLTGRSFCTVSPRTFPSIISSEAVLTQLFESDSLAKSIGCLASNEKELNVAVSSSPELTANLPNLSSKVKLEDCSAKVELCTALTFNSFAIENSNDQASDATASINEANPISCVTSNTTPSVPMDLLDSRKSTMANCAELEPVDDSRKVSSIAPAHSDGHVGSSLVSS